MSTQRILFVRHSQTRVDPGRSSHEWDLTDLGVERSHALADRLATEPIVGLVSSPEKKTRATAAPVAERLGLEIGLLDGLREMERSAEPVTTPEEFRRSVEAVFDRPDEIVYGTESAREALARFTRAVEEALERFPEGDIVAFTHGTVLSLFLAAHNGDIDGVDVWNRLGMPALAVVSVPGYRLEHLQIQIE